MGRVVQDVVTRPVRKWARLQGTDGYIEWVCGFEPGKDAVKYSGPGGEAWSRPSPRPVPTTLFLSFGTLSAAMKGDARSLALGHRARPGHDDGGRRQPPFGSDGNGRFT